MKKIFFLIILAAACKPEENKSDIEFAIKSISARDWETYEGKWRTDAGVVRMELSLTSSSNNVDSYYKLHESLESDGGASGTVSKGKFTFYPGVVNDEFGIRLHNLAEYTKGAPFRFKESKYMDSSEEMFFITRGVDVLIPTDEDFNPIAADDVFTLRKRLEYFTVEGYVTFDNDTARYYERNTMQYWKVAAIGEFDDLKVKYNQLVKEKHEGLYLKALAYSITDTSTPTEMALVIKRIKAIGNDPEVSTE